MVVTPAGPFMVPGLERRHAFSLPLGKTVAVRSFRFYGFNHDGAGSLAAALNEDGLTAEVIAPARDYLPEWGVVAHGDERSEGLLEVLAQFYGGRYEGEGLAGA